MLVPLVNAVTMFVKIAFVIVFLAPCVMTLVGAVWLIVRPWYEYNSWRWNR
jgi:hypothetical protein